MVVPGGPPSTISLHCPSSAVALNGAVTRQGRGVVVRRAIPGTDSSDWSFRVAAAGSGSRRVSVVLRCVALRLPSGFTSRLNVSSRSRSIAGLAPGETRSTRLGCGAAWTATGYALNAGANGAVRLAAVVPGKHGWRFTLENTGSSRVRAGVVVRCLRTKVTASGPAGTRELRFRVTRPAQSNVVGPADTTFRHTCGAGRFSLATGSSLDPAASIELARSSPAGPADGRWTVRSASGGDNVDTFLVCLSRASRFR
jgi:hypothetical protein